MKEVEPHPVADGWLGLTFSPDGKFVYVGGGSQAAVFEFTFTDGKTQAGAHLSVVAPDEAHRAATSSATSRSLPTAA